MGGEKYLSHLRTLKEIILDEERLVTYVSISKEFCIHVNESKLLMMKVVEEIKEKHADAALNITYIVSGLTGDNKARTLVCPETDVNQYRKELKLVFFYHIYSINKGKSLTVDKVALMAVTTFDDYQLCTGLLKSNTCFKHSLEDVARLKSCSEVLVSQQKVTNPPVNKVKVENVKPDTNGYGDTKTLNIKADSSVKQEKVSPEKNTVNINKQKSEVKTTNKPQKGIAGFFSRSDNASTKKTPKESKSTEPESKVKSEPSSIKANEQMDVDDLADKETLNVELQNHEEKSVSQSELNKKDNAALKNKSKNNNKSFTQIKKNAKLDKKRKRVLHISDSESDEDKDDPFVDEEDVLNKQINVDSEDEIPPTPAANTIKVSSNMLNPRKRRKIVNKTYTDEDGYILTRKEEVYESLSENEDSPNMKENIEKVKKNNKEINEKVANAEVSPSKSKKNGQKTNKKKISPPQKGKQATLMSFFKKA